MKANKFINLSFLMVFFLSALYNLSFIKPHNIIGDAKSNFDSSIYISFNHNNLSDDKKIKVGSRSIIVPYINSIFIKTYFKKNEIKACYEEIDLKDKTATYEQRASRLSESCKRIHVGLQYFFLILFYFLIFITVLIGKILHLNKKFLLLIFLLLSFNTFFISKVLSDSTEILSAIFFNLSIISIHYYIKNYYFSSIFGFCLGILLLFKKIFIFSPLLIIAISILFVLKNINIKKVFLSATFALVFFSISFFSSLIFFEKFKIKNKDLYLSKGNHILVIRASYLININVKNYLIAAISFTPIYGNIILEKFKNHEIVKPFLNDPKKNGRERNSIMIYSNPNVLDYYMKENNIDEINLENYKNYFSNGVLNYSTVIDVYKRNIFKNIVCTPLFLYRSLFPGIGKDVLNNNYKNFSIDIFKILLNIYKILNPILIVTLVIFFFLSLKNIYKNNHLIIMSLPMFSLFLHAFITHGIGRYSVIIIPFSIVILCLSINEYKFKNHD